jgi:hypothetical protein
MKVVPKRPSIGVELKAVEAPVGPSSAPLLKDRPIYYCNEVDGMGSQLGLGNKYSETAAPFNDAMRPLEQLYIGKELPIPLIFPRTICYG